MPFDGFGNFLRLYSWVVDATNSVKIRADRHDDEDNNFTAGLSQCITKDGQSIISQNIPFNSRRIISLADPVNPQDASTKAYADTKLSATGGGTVTGNVIINGGLTTTGAITAGGPVSAVGYATRKGVAGPYGVNSFNFDWTGNLEAWVDNINLGALATQAFANTAAANAANTKLPLAGGTISGNLQVTGEVGVNSNILRFGAIGTSLGYIQWQGGATYVLGGGGTIWHSGNFNPASSSLISNVKLVLAGDVFISGEIGVAPVPEPFYGAVMTGVGAVSLAYKGRFRYLQVFTTNWFTVSYSAS